VVLTDVSEVRIASIFRVEGKNKKILKPRNSEGKCNTSTRRHILETNFFIVTAMKTSNLTNEYI
jgi:hypothetical protein